MARRAAVLLVAVVVLAIASVLPPSVASGQAVETSPAAGLGPALLAAVTPDPLDPPPIQVSGVWIAADAVDTRSGVAAVAVAFENEFEVPREPWRVAVSVGDPRGQRVRASLVSVGSAGVSGRIEQGDGVQWDDAGPTEVIATGDGLVTIGVPIGGAVDGAVLWVEAEATIDTELVVSRTPTFPLVDLLGQRPGPAVGTSPFAVVAGERDAQPVPVDASGLTAQVVDQVLEVTTTATPPAEADGVAVVDVIDTVTITDSGSGTATSRLEIDRRTGEVRLATDAAETFVAVPGTTPWLVDPPALTDPGAPSTVTFDLDALNQAVGGPPFDRSSSRVGVSRTLALDDGRILDAAGVGGTLGWFDAAAPAPAVVASSAGGSDGVPASVWIMAGVGVVLVAMAVWLVARRRRAAEPRPIERLDLAFTPVAAGVPSLAPVALRSASAPSGGASSPASSQVSSALTAPETPSVPMATVDEPVPVPPPEPGDTDPLAVFLAEVDELTARVDRLGGAVDPESAPTVPAGEGGARRR